MTPSTTTIICSSCNGKGLKPSSYYSAHMLVNCKACKGHGRITICTECGSQVSYNRSGAVCGCNSVALRQAA